MENGRLGLQGPDLIAQRVNVERLGDDAVTAMAIGPMDLAGVRQDSHPMAGLAKLGDQRQHRPVQGENVGRGRSKPIKVGPTAGGGAKKFVELAARKPADLVLPHQTVVEQNRVDLIGRKARHCGHLLEHLIDAEIQQDFAEVEVEELGLHVR